MSDLEITLPELLSSTGFIYTSLKLVNYSPPSLDEAWFILFVICIYFSSVIC